MDEACTRADEQLAEFRELLRDEMVKAYAMLGALAAPVELQLCQDEPAAGIWGDQTSPSRKRARASNRPPVTPRSDKLDAMSWITETGHLLTAVGVGSILGSLIVAQLGGPAVMIRGGSRRVWCHSVRRRLGGCSLTGG